MNYKLKIERKDSVEWMFIISSIMAVIAPSTIWGYTGIMLFLSLIALKVKEVFELEDINELPIAFNIAWYEQKAVIVLLSLLYLGVKNIHLGPTLPAFLSPNVAKVLVENFGIGGITNVEDDMKMFLK